MFTGFHVTDKGHRYMAKAVEGKTLILTKAQYGNGELPEETAITSVTELISPLADMPISKKSSMSNIMTTTTQFSNKVNGKLLKPFYFMEAGVFGKVKNADGTDDEDAPETLVFYANAITADKADYIPGTLTEFILNWPLTIRGGAEVTVEINESLIYPTMKEFHERVPFKLEIATSEEAKEGTNDSKMMTPAKTKVYVDKVVGDINTILDTINGKVV